jgi:hypothetical protein
LDADVDFSDEAGNSGGFIPGSPKTFFQGYTPLDGTTLEVSSKLLSFHPGDGLLENPSA